LTAIRNILKENLEGVLNSYSMVFFSKNIAFAIILIGISFFNPVAGFSGLLSVLIANILARVMGFNRQNILSGLYGFNSLLTGLGLGSYFQFSPEFLLVLVTASVMTMLFTIFLEGMIGKYGLPYLTLPFLISFWLLTLATRQYSGLTLSERDIFMYNQMYAIGENGMVKLYDWFTNTSLPMPWVVYFKSLSAIFFQYHLFAGMLIAAGLLYYSRIAFLLSLTGYFSAYYFYVFIGASLDELNYSYIGFNFILTSIAIGGFFIVSSRASFLWVVLLTPIISILISGSSAVLALMQLSTFSLPFNIVVLLFLYSLKLREHAKPQLELVSFQEFSPERNLYTRLNTRKRFSGPLGPALSLPFMGEWMVSQAHSGEYTHQDKWRHAWDFVITGPDGKQYSGNGHRPSDYYCYDKPVISPADGWVEEILDNIEDNAIGEVNLAHNWGNTIIIRHTNLLFTQISHLRKGSFRVQKGVFVKKGDLLAFCGNSGRSPMPHIHFQAQATPYIGSATLDYPINGYIVHDGKKAVLSSFSRPSQNELISNVTPNNCIAKAFSLIPGQQIIFSASADGGTKETVTWEVKTDIYNYTFLHCGTTGSKAWFNNDGKQFSFTWFEGDRDSLLFIVYKGAYKMATGYFRGLEVHDELPLNMLRWNPVKVLQDMVAPFYIFMKFPYQMHYQSMDDELSQSEITVKSQSWIQLFGKRKSMTETTLFFDHNRLEKIISVKNGKTTLAKNSAKKIF